MGAQVSSCPPARAGKPNSIWSSRQFGSGAHDTFLSSTSSQKLIWHSSPILAYTFPSRRDSPRDRASHYQAKELPAVVGVLSGLDRPLQEREPPWRTRS